MKNSKLKAFIFYFLIGLIFLDFGNQMRILAQKPEILALNNPVFTFTNIKNTGSAFGLFEGNSLLLAIIGIFVLLFLIFYIHKHISYEDKLELFSITVFSAGALGNLIERIKFGHVIDYIKLNFVDFPIFNTFDIMICTGVFLYFVMVLGEEIKKHGKNPNKTR